MRAYYTVYDFENFQVGVAPSVDSSSTFDRNPLPKWAVITVSVVASVIGVVLLSVMTYYLYRKRAVSKGRIFYEDLVK